jgi:hypothetical protein
MRLKTNEEIFMTPQEKAQRLFKQDRLSGSQSSIPEYEQRARTERTKTAKLRMLRLARDAATALKPEQTGGTAEMQTPPMSQRLRNGACRRD